MKIIAHRGESKYATENSMHAFYLAYLDGADGIETDVRKTKDNVLILTHDKTVDRLSNKKGKVINYNYDELLKIDFKGEKIVKLEEFLKFFGNKQVILEIELKSSGYEEKIYRMLKKYEIENAIIISFKYDVLQKMRELDENLKLGYLVKFINNKVINDSIKIGAIQVICLAIMINEDDVIELHNNDIKVYAWGLLSNKEIKRLNSINVDGVIVDSYKDATKYVK